MSNWVQMLLSLLGRNEQIINKLSETRVMRRAAQYTAAMYHKSKDMGEDMQGKLKDYNAPQRIEGFKNTFSNELKSGLEDLKRDMKQQKDKD